MKNKLTKSNLIIAQRGVSLVVVFATLLTAFVAIAPWTYGWFAKNNKVTASGMHTQAYYSRFDVTYAVKQDGEYKPAEPNALFNTIIAPGYSAEIQITITNKSSNKYAVNLTGFGLEAPTADQEIAKVDSAGKIRYLSTELTTELLGVTVAYPSTNTNTPPAYSVTMQSVPVQLREGTSTEPGAAGRIDYVRYVKDVETTPISVPVGGSVTFTIRVTFKNTDYDQNIYKDFAGTGGKCERKFFFTFEDDMSTSN